MKTGREVEVVVERFVEKGRAAARVDSKWAHIPFAVPGDRARIRLVGKRKGIFDGRIVELLEPSPLRDEPRCDYFGACGGCARQNVLYSAQLDWKREIVEAAFQEAGVLGGETVPPVLPAQSLYEYRNKMEFSFGAQRWLARSEIERGGEYRRDFALGLHVPGRFDRILDVDRCHLQGEATRRLLDATRRFALERGLEPWNVRRAEGFLRHLVVRVSHATGRMLADLVTSRRDEEVARDYVAAVRQDVPEIETITNTINSGVAQVATGDETYVDYGPGVLEERVAGLRFLLGPHDFFQTNTEQAERLYELTASFAAPEADEVVYDLYCGLGPITLLLARTAKKAVGIEIDPSTATRALEAARLNGVANVTFVAGDLVDRLGAQLVRREGAPDVVVVDPPRAGIHPRILEKVALLGAPRLVYVSCNPKTQARDLVKLLRQYEIRRIQPIDLFPHTDHIENVVLLERK